MTHRIQKSTILPATEADLQRCVLNFATELAAWLNHADAVRSGIADPYPAPTAHPDIMAAVRQDRADDGSIVVMPDYEVVDDGPSAADVLAAKKRELSAAVVDAEVAASERVFPTAKRRLWLLTAADVAAKRTASEQALLASIDAKVGPTEAERETLNSLREKKDDLTEDEKKRVVEIMAKRAPSDQEIEVAAMIRAKQQRTPDDEAFEARFAAVRQALDAINRWGAERLAEIDDLTGDGVDSYVVGVPPTE